MSHFLLSKRIWLVVLGLSCLFFVLTYIWFYYMNQWAMQARRIELKQEEVAAVAEQIRPLWVEEVVQAAWTNEEPHEVEKPQLTFPCLVQLVDGSIGVFNQEGQLCKTMRQVSEYLSDRDKEELTEGILAQDNFEFIMVCESFHLQ